MKRFFLLILFLPAVSLLNATDKITETVSVNNSSQIAVEQTSLTIPSGFTYSGTNPSYTSFAIYTNMGVLKDSIEVGVKKEDSAKTDTTIYVKRKRTYRTIYLFSLTSIKYTATNHANVTLVKVNYSTTGYNHTFKITNPNSYPGSDEAIWATVGNSTTTQSGVTYSGYIINPASGLNSPITANLSSINHEIYLGITSEADTTNGSTAQVSTFSLEITYERDNEVRTVIAQNNMHDYTGGQIYWNGNLVTSPKSDTLHENETRSFGVYSPQNFSGYNYIWNTGGVNTSEWMKIIGSGLPISAGSNTTVQYTTSWAEVGTITHTAKMKRICNVTFTGAGGTVSIDGGTAQSFPQTRQVVELNPVTAVASNYSGGGINYTFNNSWTTSSGEIVSTSITPSRHETYSANYNSAITGNTTLQNNIIVPVGYTLNIASGVMVNLNGYSIISTGGTINKQSGATINGVAAYITSAGVLKGICPTIQSALTNAPSSGCFVQIQPGTYSENVSVSNKSYLIITGDELNTNLTGNMSFYNCPDLEIHKIKSKNVTLSNCASPNIYHTVNGSGTDGGIHLFSCTGFQREDAANNAYCGLNANSSTGDIGPGASFYNNDIAVIAGNGSEITMEYAQLCGNITTDLYAITGGLIDAYECYYNNATPRIYEYLNGRVVVHSVRECGLMKKGSETEFPTSIISDTLKTDDPAELEYLTLRNEYYKLHRRIKDDIKLLGVFHKDKFRNEHISIIKSYKAFLKKYPNSEYAKNALLVAAKSFSRYDDYNRMKEFLDDIIADKKTASLKGLAENFMVDYYRDIKDFDKAIKQADYVAEEYGYDDNLVCGAMYNKALMLAHDLNKPEEAVACLRSIIKTYPENGLK